MAAPISVAEFKTKFDRNFPFGAGLDSVRDTDIQNAIDEALLLYNPTLFSTADGKQVFYYAAAHFLDVNIQTAGGLTALTTPSNQGVNNRSNGVIISKTVGQVSVNYADMPERVKKIAVLQAFWETEYGKRYVIMLSPKLSGNVGVVSGPVDPLVGDQRVPFAGP
jgi:hypothetical protein